MPQPRRQPRPRPLPTPHAGRRIARKAAERAHPAGGNGGSAAALADASPRFREVHAALDRELRQRFPQAEPVEAYGMPGWRVARPRPVEWTHGTIDPNLVQVFLAERAQGGLSLHLWNPYDPGLLAKHQEELEDAGFTVMVGCLQYKRKADYPVGALLPLLDGIAGAMAKENGPAGKAAKPGKASKSAKGAAEGGKAGKGSKPARKPGSSTGKGPGKGRSKA